MFNHNYIVGKFIYKMIAQRKNVTLYIGNITGTFIANIAVNLASWKPISLEFSKRSGLPRIEIEIGERL